MHKNQITINQLLCLTEKINSKKEIVSTVIVKNLIKQKINKKTKKFIHLQISKDQIDRRIKFKKRQNDRRRLKIYLISTIIESIFFEES